MEFVVITLVLGSHTVQGSSCRQFFSLCWSLVVLFPRRYTLYVQVCRCTCWEECFHDVPHRFRACELCLSLSFELGHHGPVCPWIDVRTVTGCFELSSLAVLSSRLAFLKLAKSSSKLSLPWIFLLWSEQVRSRLFSSFLISLVHDPSGHCNITFVMWASMFVMLSSVPSVMSSLPMRRSIIYMSISSASLHFPVVVGIIWGFLHLASIMIIWWWLAVHS